MAEVPGGAAERHRGPAGAKRQDDRPESRPGVRSVSARLGQVWALGAPAILADFLKEIHQFWPQNPTLFIKHCLNLLKTMIILNIVQTMFKQCLNSA